MIGRDSSNRVMHLFNFRVCLMDTSGSLDRVRAGSRWTVVTLGGRLP